MFGFDLKTGALSSDWPATGLDIGLPNPAVGGRIGGGVFAASPPIIYKNLIITTAATGFLPPPAQPADPHANDLRTGKLVWTARLIPGAGEPGGDSWGPDTQSVVGSGAWGILGLDEASRWRLCPHGGRQPRLCRHLTPRRQCWFRRDGRAGCRDRQGEEAALPEPASP